MAGQQLRPAVFFAAVTFSLACLSLYRRLAPQLDQDLAGKQCGDGLSSRGCGIPPLDEPCNNLVAYSPTFHNSCNCSNYCRYPCEDGTLGSKLIESKIQRLTKWLENYHLWRTSRLGFEVMHAFAQTFRTFRRTPRLPSSQIPKLFFNYFISLKILSIGD